MKKVILTIGPQFAGKSTFCERVLTQFPHIKYISRDAILREMFGTVWLDSYSGGHFVAWEELWKMVERQCKEKEFTLILDAWNGSRREREDIVEKLRSFGAKYIEGWYFITPLEQCVEWSLIMQPISARTKEWEEIKFASRKNLIGYNHNGFHSENIEEDKSFDSIRRINPLETKPETIFETIVVM